MNITIGTDKAEIMIPAIPPLDSVDFGVGVGVEVGVGANVGEVLVEIDIT